MSRKHHTVLHRPMHRAGFANGHEIRNKSGVVLRAEQERFLAKQKRKPKVLRKPWRPRSIPELLEACRVDQTITDILQVCTIWYWGPGPYVYGELGDYIHIERKTTFVSARQRGFIDVDYSTIERRIVAMYQRIFRQARGRAYP